MGAGRIITVGRSIRIFQGHRIPIGVCGTGGDVHKKLAGLGGTGGYGFYHRDIRRGVGDRDAFRMGGDTRFAVGDRGGQGKCAGVMVLATKAANSPLVMISSGCASPSG